MRSRDTMLEDRPASAFNTLLRTVNRAEISIGRLLRPPTGSNLVLTAKKTAWSIPQPGSLDVMDYLLFTRMTLTMPERLLPPAWRRSLLTGNGGESPTARQSTTPKSIAAASTT
ncbi:MAG: hypothetical protein H7A20_04010 [Rhodanobacteraceae bacterium]|nr:hypothetical protein [Rhodanobacteraceae bacterium]